MIKPYTNKHKTKQLRKQLNYNEKHKKTNKNHLQTQLKTFIRLRNLTKPLQNLYKTINKNKQIQSKTKKKNRISHEQAI